MNFPFVLLRSFSCFFLSFLAITLPKVVRYSRAKFDRSRQKASTYMVVMSSVGVAYKMGRS